jgi:hypothetical protein
VLFVFVRLRLLLQEVEVSTKKTKFFMAKKREFKFKVMYPVTYHTGIIDNVSVKRYSKSVNNF